MCTEIKSSNIRKSPLEIVSAIVAARVSIVMVSPEMTKIIILCTPVSLHYDFYMKLIISDSIYSSPG